MSTYLPQRDTTYLLSIRHVVYAPLVQKYAEPTQLIFEKKVGRRGLPELNPDGKPGYIVRNG